MICFLFWLAETAERHHQYWPCFVFVFSGLNLRDTKVLLFLNIVRGNYNLAIRKWIQKRHPKTLSPKRKKISKLIVDETIIKLGQDSPGLIGCCHHRTKNQGNSHTK